MRVLWLCSTPGLGARHLGASAALVGGWIAALEEALEGIDDLHLSLAFPWRVDEIRPISSERRDYLPYPRYPRGSRLRRALFDLSCRLEPERELRHLERAVELAKPDLIHAWGTEHVFGRIAERTRVPVLVEIQGLRTQCTEAYFNGLSAGDLFRHGSPYRMLLGRSLLHRYYRYRRSAQRERQILSAARFVSGRTDWDRQSCAVLAPKARYFHCDRVLRPPFSRAVWGHRDDGTLRLVSILRGNAYKGVETIWACARLLADLWAGDVDWSLVGVREGEEIVRVVEQKLGAKAGSLGIQPLGRLTAEAVADRLSAGGIYVHPSHIDNSPNGLCEAMSVGAPVVATRVGGIPSLVESGGDGLLVPPGDPWAMTGAILELARDGERAQRLAAAARHRARERHDPARVARSLVGNYREILAS